MPNKFAATLKKFAEENQLGPDDPLCYGIKGLALQNKQLNRITDKICDYLEWKEERKITPHGFRYSIATFLDEKGLSLDTIQYQLGHKSNENVQLYLRRDRKKIHQIRNVLNEIENELESHLEQMNSTSTPNHLDEPVFDFSPHEENNAGKGLPFTEDFLLKLSLENPNMFEKIMTQYLQNNSYPRSS